MKIILSAQITWLCNGDFVKESEKKVARVEAREGEKNKWVATLTILVRVHGFSCHQNTEKTVANFSPFSHRLCCPSVSSITLCFRTPTRLTPGTTSAPSRTSGAMTTPPSTWARTPTLDIRVCTFDLSHIHPPVLFGVINF